LSIFYRNPADRGQTNPLRLWVNLLMFCCSTRFDFDQNSTYQTFPRDNYLSVGQNVLEEVQRAAPFPIPDHVAPTIQVLAGFDLDNNARFAATRLLQGTGTTLLDLERFCGQSIGHVISQKYQLFR